MNIQNQGVVMMAWNQHPIAKIQNEIDDYNVSLKKEWRRKRFSVYKQRTENIHLCEFYCQQLLKGNYITLEEYKYVVLLPYQGLLPASLNTKTEVSVHKLLFLCGEEELYPLILRQVIQYLSYIYCEAGYRRELLLDVVHFADSAKRKGIYKMAKECRYLGEIITKFNLQEIYQKYPDKAEAYYYCLMTKKLVQQL